MQRDMCMDNNYKGKLHGFNATLGSAQARPGTTISIVGWKMVWQRVSGRPWLVEVELVAAKGRLKVMKA